MKYLILTLPFVLCGCMAELLPKIQHALFVAERAQDVATTAAGLGIPFATEAAGAAALGSTVIAVLLRQAVKLMKDRMDGADKLIRKGQAEVQELKAANGNGDQISTGTSS